ncbi:flagellar hook protein FlgE [Marivita lacus]|uniref:Flagellar hook protein FlgE n=1 Tax=Marivita lacus TaxID=1323742 RepID=A0ABQ1KXC4_9RHOB|nr:flagellar hook-basal body complex protein [Marivita lacus]GGC09973.1 flagellar hook protein FlgE [Marivita lacus]
MSILNAMQAGVSGLSANAKAVSLIGENIANTGTVGFKRSFAQMVTINSGDAAGVRAQRASEVSAAGTNIMTRSATDLAIGGQGFFVVSKQPNDPVLANYMLTRAGSFSVDADGNLKNAAGYYLSGFKYDDTGTIGAVDRRSYGSLETINLGDVELTAAASTTATISGNLPADATGTGAAAGSFVSTVGYYNDLGAEEQLTLTWTPDPAIENRWTLDVAGGGTAYGTVEVDFHDSGATPAAPLLYTGPGAPPLALDAATGEMTITINNALIPQVLTIALGAPDTYDGITQFAGDYEPQRVTIDGSEVSDMASTEIDESGIVWALFENGVRKALYEIPVANVANVEGLQAVTGNAYQLTSESGDVLLNVAGNQPAGSILSNTLENSNVDLAQEMTDLIMVQRAYQSNSKIVTTADELLQEANNLKR